LKGKKGSGKKKDETTRRQGGPKKSGGGLEKTKIIPKEKANPKQGTSPRTHRGRIKNQTGKRKKLLGKKNTSLNQKDYKIKGIIGGNINVLKNNGWKKNLKEGGQKKNQDLKMQRFKIKVPGRREMLEKLENGSKREKKSLRRKGGAIKGNDGKFLGRKS